MFAEDPAIPPEIEPKSTRARFSGWVAYRAVIPVEKLSTELGKDWGEQTLWLGRNKVGTRCECFPRYAYHPYCFLETLNVDALSEGDRG